MYNNYCNITDQFGIFPHVLGAENLLVKVINGESY